jgi:superfamily II DNA or RNA helicase
VTPDNQLRRAIEEERARLARLDAERATAAARLAILEGQFKSLSAAGAEQVAHTPQPDVPRTPAVKVRLFRSLFRGRPDVYPTRFVSKRTGTPGYAPACANKFVRGVCGLPAIRCSECPNQAFLPADDQAILDHLRGRHVMGVYTLLEDETCWLLAVDFDKASWRDDVAAFVATARDAGVPAAVERSRSGNGAHVWFFFAAPVPASAARGMGCHLITETMSHHHQLAMDSYDRLFPNQDTMPRGGFGNLIALPLQREPRKQGNTLFVDDAFQPYRDQWAFLAGVPRMEPSAVLALAEEATRTGQVTGVRSVDPVDEAEPAPWTRTPSGRARPPAIAGPLPERVRAVLAQRLFLEKAGLPSPLLNQIKRLAAFQNPAFYAKQRMRLSTALTPRIVACAEELPRHMALPRGCVSDLEKLLDEYGVHLAVEDRREDGEPLAVRFDGELTSLQQRAARALLRHETGVLVAPPGVGKTVLGTYLIAQRARSTLVLVHRQPLLDQWIAHLSMFLGVAEKEIGWVGAGKRKPNGRLDVAMLQSLVRQGAVEDLVTGYGHVIVDECHHVPAVSFERVLSEVRARYVLGLTATPQRRDGHHPILEMQLGPVRFLVDAKNQAAKRPFQHRLVVRGTPFRLEPATADRGIQAIYRALAEDQARNRMIIEDVAQALGEGRSPILLTERRDHLEYLAERLRSQVRHMVVLQGGMKPKDRRALGQVLAAVPDGDERLVLATGRYIGEGFDDARLDTLFLAMPVSWKGTLVQYSGRLHRLHPRKTEVRIFDYVDPEVPLLLRMFEKRLRTYRAIGYARGAAPLGFGEPVDSVKDPEGQGSLLDVQEEA